MKVRSMALASLTASAITGLACAYSMSAGTPAGIARTIVLRQGSSIPGYEGVVATVVLAPGAAEGLHTHHADVYGYVIEGSATSEKAASPTLTLHAGEAFYIAAGVVHQGINNGKVPAKIVAVFVAEKGQPLATPAE